jgi:hypothetical protein
LTEQKEWSLREDGVHTCCEKKRDFKKKGIEKRNAVIAFVYKKKAKQMVIV